ncbi:MAG TPA: tRNA (adenosine(37)-N6)-threonylcarbamoyltransferase complex dimerization subunit type 1 TsaB [Gemmatimonadales bacterium]|nr:tRNA (adenosine(37)-N6)-threonylcarbamoyltransferase complex dimerization subunit type 1 TsaB [Gemmatimonadales bacterium]
MNAPKNWLAIDTATDIASVAISTELGSVERSIRGARRHAAEIIPLVQEVLKLAGATTNDLEGVIVADGPGSFTGVRIGWAAAKGLIHERRLPLVTIPSLLAAAYGAGVETVAACYDALRGQVFGAVYRFKPDGLQAIVPPTLCTMPRLMTMVMPRPAPIVAVGDGAERYADIVKAWTGRDPIGLGELPTLAGSLLSLYPYPSAHRVIEDPNVAEPVYGRLAEAQVKWEARYGRPLPNSPR